MFGSELAELGQVICVGAGNLPKTGQSSFNKFIFQQICVPLIHLDYITPWEI